MKFLFPLSVILYFFCSWAVPENPPCATLTLLCVPPEKSRCWANENKYVRNFQGLRKYWLTQPSFVFFDQNGGSASTRCPKWPRKTFSFFPWSVKCVFELFVNCERTVLFSVKRDLQSPFTTRLLEWISNVIFFRRGRSTQRKDAGVLVFGAMAKNHCSGPQVKLLTLF